MHDKYLYYDWEGVPCRVKLEQGEAVSAEQYLQGEGFVRAPLMKIQNKAAIRSKAEFDAQILAIVRASRNEI